MSPSPPESVHVLFLQEGESWATLVERLRGTQGEMLLVLSGHEEELVGKAEMSGAFLDACRSLQGRLRVATKHPLLASRLRANGVRVFDRTKYVRALLAGHPKLEDVLREFSPQLWRQQLKSRLQRMGLLSVPRVRILLLVGVSALLFFFVVFRLLPSALIRIRPRQDPVSQTVNIFLVQSQSGSVAGVSDRVRRMPLIPIEVTVRRQMHFANISKEFIGTSSAVMLTIINKSRDMYSLRKGTRFTNQAGMVFKIQDIAIVDPGEEVAVRAKADDTDLYDQIIGDRGNVPEGLKWEIPGLSVDERKLVYAVNRKPATGGTTAYRTVLRQADIEVARRRLEQELLAAAKEAAEAERRRLNAADRSRFVTMLDYAELTRVTYNDFTLPTAQIGQIVASVSLEGGITYTAFAYDAEAITTMLRKELRSHVRDGRILMEDAIDRTDLVVHVIDYADEFSWIKLTVDLTAAEEYILDPLSPSGALFNKKLRETIVGLPKSEALRIIKNMPEVESVSIAIWPPWRRAIPSIAPHLTIEEF